jgi:hypothetical protein
MTKSSLIRIVLAALFMSFLLPIQAATAGNGFCEADDPCGGWVVIDENGTVVSGAQVCTPSVCGDPNSSFSKAVLKPGQRYVQQTYADPNTGNVAGIGNNNPGTVLTYDNNSQLFTMTRETPSGSQVSIFGLNDTRDGIIRVSHPDGIVVLPDTSTISSDTSTAEIDSLTVNLIQPTIESRTVASAPKITPKAAIAAPKKVVKLTSKQIAAAKAKALALAKMTKKKSTSN